jgi:hypothetical protein
MNIGTLKSALGAIVLAVTLVGCESNDTIYVSDVDLTPPATPRGVYSVTGDREVTVVWLGSDEQDLAGYLVYRSRTLEGPYDVVADIQVSDLPLQLEYKDRGVVNGETYFYAVTSYDYEGNESELSYEDVFDTPRPAGRDVRLHAREANSSDAGFDFSRQDVVSANDSRADIVITLDGGVFFVEAVSYDESITDIQDFGYTESLDALDWAPPDGWSTLGWAEIILGHTYAVWTWDDHYAKFRVTEIGETSIVIDWAYQIDPGNPELKPAIPPTNSNRPIAGVQ